MELLMNADFLWSTISTTSYYGASRTKPYQGLLLGDRVMSMGNVAISQCIV